MIFTISLLLLLVKKVRNEIFANNLSKFYRIFSNFIQNSLFIYAIYAFFCQIIAILNKSFKKIY